MSTMHSVHINQHGDSSLLAYTEAPKPVIKPDQILVKVAYAGVNFIDTYQRSGLYPQKFPFTLGREGSGEVVEIGSEVQGIDFKVGDRVVYLAPESYAEYTAMSPASVAKLPDAISLEKAAAVLLQGLTAWTLVTQAYKVEKGDWVLIHAAAGGMGLQLCQLCKQLGANVIGTTSTEAKAQLAMAHGADYVVNYSNGYDELVVKVNELTGNKGVHVAFDGVGASTFDVSLKVLRRLGSLISFGNASGAVPPISIMKLAEKNVRLMRPTLFNFFSTREEFVELCQGLFKLVEDGKLDVAIHKVYPIQDVRQAHDDLEGRKTTGKLVLKI
ncbi:NADPH:quinone reductase [Lunasporangiospora selenospora]|uniref:Probable quinone oxidoreductase n=1 Tax=Lunasporangiospora selenospora TaxID=979761 RepID=A0A9P6FXP9_9FUNG|nr:NADPH:quinone reductase [Lunasporangiospora selenospora]